MNKFLKRLSILSFPLRFLFLIFTLIATVTFPSGNVQASTYSERICPKPEFQCIEVKEGDSWESLWPDEGQRDLVRRVNRLNLRLRPGRILAVPNELENKSLLDLSPMPPSIDPPGEREIRVDLNQLAWGAYNAEGKLVNWGAAVGGKAYCPDVGRACRTRTGEFRIKRKGGGGCKSKKFPIPKGGAPMPYCMFYYGGYALHGSYNVPGYNASHGCVRLFPEDAKWLNQEFATGHLEGDTAVGTRVYLLPYAK